MGLLGESGTTGTSRKTKNPVPIHKTAGSVGASFLEHNSPVSLRERVRFPLHRQDRSRLPMHPCGVFLCLHSRSCFAHTRYPGENTSLSTERPHFPHRCDLLLPGTRLAHATTLLAPQWPHPRATTIRFSLNRRDTFAHDIALRVHVDLALPLRVLETIPTSLPRRAVIAHQSRSSAPSSRFCVHREKTFSTVKIGVTRRRRIPHPCPVLSSPSSHLPSPSALSSAALSLPSPPAPLLTFTTGQRGACTRPFARQKGAILAAFHIAGSIFPFSRTPVMCW
ncbi:hypothetical protein F5148DRAFT_145292 [Russula earlei]|uniref:Uncharacterized protein n=1 Tax=Russula earlei TaxID=71964 RepID=A0ACC0TR45_9AGAM|nr:hypothetical protein F5148DRAFT_145292 [Russula earlei]